MCVYLGGKYRLQGFETGEQVDILRRSLGLLAICKHVEQSVQSLAARHQIPVFRCDIQQRGSYQLRKRGEITRKLITQVYY